MVRRRACGSKTRRGRERWPAYPNEARAAYPRDRYDPRRVICGRVEDDDRRAVPVLCRPGDH